MSYNVNLQVGDIFTNANGHTYLVLRPHYYKNCFGDIYNFILCYDNKDKRYIIANGVYRSGAYHNWEHGNYFDQDLVEVMERFDRKLKELEE